ncbi:hypothetical protein R3P38DRAFT_2760911 [Favolaschia claudopus]|uniref:Uncharacterized protein n=1 Tax=Favolaschia claudopus TaxID=2862362 RepID=A0AAW0DVX4_9AGAR
MPFALRALNHLLPVPFDSSRDSKPSCNTSIFDGIAQIPYPHPSGTLLPSREKRRRHIRFCLKPLETKHTPSVTPTPPPVPLRACGVHQCLNSGDLHPAPSCTIHSHPVQRRIHKRRVKTFTWGVVPTLASLAFIISRVHRLAYFFVNFSSTFSFSTTLMYEEGKVPFTCPTSHFASPRHHIRPRSPAMHSAPPAAPPDPDASEDTDYSAMLAQLDSP